MGQVEADAKLPRQPLPSTVQGVTLYSRDLPERSWTAYPWQPWRLNCPWEWKAAGLGPAGQHSALELICCVTFG